jgi:hypothetical protein
VPRVKKSEYVAQEQQQLQLGLTELIGESKPRGKRAAPSVDSFMVDIVTMMKSNNWSSAKPLHMVALYCWCHEKVYGVPCAELLGKGKATTAARKGAAGAAARMLQVEFNGHVEAMAKFINWVFKREVGREKWAKENNRDRSRMTWMVLFAGRAVLTDYRADKLRKRA